MEEREIIKKELETNSYDTLTFRDPKNECVDFANLENDVYYIHLLTILLGKKSKKIIGLHIKEETSKHCENLFFNVIDNYEQMWANLIHNASLICNQKNIDFILEDLRLKLSVEEFSKFLKNVNLVFQDQVFIRPKILTRKHPVFTDEEIEIIKKEEKDMNYTGYNFGYSTQGYYYYFRIYVGNQSKRIISCEWHEGHEFKGDFEYEYASKNYYGMYELIQRKGIKYISENKLGELEEVLLPEEIDKLKKSLIEGRILNMYPPNKILPNKKKL